MKALELVAYNHFEFKDVPEPEIAEDEILIKVRAVGICGSDVHGQDGSTGRRIPPIIMGHEAAGDVTAVGPRVTNVSVGDAVTFDSTLYCGECFYCRRGEINFCENRRVLGVSADEYRQNGAFAEYVAVPARGIYVLPEGVSYEHAAMVEPVSIAMHAAEITPPMKPVMRRWWSESALLACSSCRSFARQAMDRSSPLTSTTESSRERRRSAPTG